MWNFLKALRPRTKLGKKKYGRLSMTGGFAVAALLVILVAGWLVDRRGASEPDRRLAELARTAEADPLDALVQAARANRILFLSDIHNSTPAKQLAAAAIKRIATTSGLDAVVIEVGSDQQPYIDQYLDRTPEDASVLLSHPRTIREPGAATRAFLELYHEVWQLNQKLGADERIRILAADLPGWPPDVGATGEMAEKMAKRDEQMRNVIEAEVLSRIPDARILIFMTGLHGLKTGSVSVQTGGSAAVSAQPLAARLAQSTDEVYTFLLDAPSSGVTGREVAPYVGTKVGGVLEAARVNRRFGVTIGSEFDYLRQPIIEKKTPGIEYAVNPHDYKLRDVADAYIRLN
jgi:hypothetical protein